MELQDLRYVLALARELNFTRAAASCHVSQQALSRAIARVERRLGTPIAVRRSRGCTLTPAGERLVARARPLVAEADTLLAAVRDAAPATGSLRVGLMLDGAGAATVPLLRAYRAAFPDVALQVRRLHADRALDGVLDGTVDVAVLHGPVTDERIAVTPLFSEPRIAAVSAASPHADASVLAAADLVTQPARTRRPGVRADWEGFFTLVPERGGEQPDRFGEPTGSLEELLWSIGLDRLFLTMPEHLRRTFPGELYGVRYVPVPDLPPVTFGLAHRRPAAPAVAAFAALAPSVVRAARDPGPASTVVGTP